MGQTIKAPFLRAQVFGKGVRLWAWEMAFAGDPTTLARNNINLDSNDHWQIYSFI